MVRNRMMAQMKTNGVSFLKSSPVRIRILLIDLSLSMVHLHRDKMRLVSLLKKNLSSKQIASILRVSDEGIKKARYRLRKKMVLESGQDLQGLILLL